MEPQGGRRPRNTFALRLRLLRHDVHMTQQQIADACGVKRGSWAVWEKGSVPHNQAAVAKKIADATGYDLVWILYGTA